MGALEGKTVLDVGGARSGSMGAAEARLFVNEGASVVVADVRDDRGLELVEELNHGRSTEVARYVHLDATDEDDWIRAVDAAVDWRGTIDVLVNNVGINDRSSIMTTTLETWRQVLDVNATSMFLGMRATAPVMKQAKTGSIINIASNSGTTGTPFAAYTASKWAIVGLSKTAAMEFASDGIRVNTVCPGLIRTEMNDGTQFFDALARTVPLGHAGLPEDIAEAVLYLASDRSRYVTGQDLGVDGGLPLPNYVLRDFV